MVAVMILFEIHNPLSIAIALDLMLYEYRPSDLTFVGKYLEINFAPAAIHLSFLMID